MVCVILGYGCLKVRIFLILLFLMGVLVVVFSSIGLMLKKGRVVVLGFVGVMFVRGVMIWDLVLVC